MAWYLVKQRNSFTFTCLSNNTGREADHSAPSSAEVKNAWSYISTPPILPHGVVFNKAMDMSSWHGT
jgi:hypothetical protein